MREFTTDEEFLEFRVRCAAIGLINHRVHKIHKVSDHVVCLFTNDDLIHIFTKHGFLYYHILSIMWNGCQLTLDTLHNDCHDPELLSIGIKYITQFYDAAKIKCNTSESTALKAVSNMGVLDHCDMSAPETIPMYTPFQFLLTQDFDDDKLELVIVALDEEEIFATTIKTKTVYHDEHELYLTRKNFH